MLKNKFIALLIAAVIAIFGNMPANLAFAVSQDQQPVAAKSELKHVLKKFALSMSLVGGSCLVLYFALKTYKRFKEEEEAGQPYPVDTEKCLNTPETIEEATKLFIEKF